MKSPANVEITWGQCPHVWVQRSALKIILGSTLTDYEESLEEINVDTLKTRRDKLCLNFAESCIKDTKFCSWFPKGIETRSGHHFAEPEAKTQRYRNSAVPYLTRSLNSSTK